jgi:hypothetical protein
MRENVICSWVTPRSAAAKGQSIRCPRAALRFTVDRYSGCVLSHAPIDRVEYAAQANCPVIQATVGFQKDTYADKPDQGQQERWNEGPVFHTLPTAR